jgi:hypothetical protein
MKIKIHFQFSVFENDMKNNFLWQNANQVLKHRQRANKSKKVGVRIARFFMVNDNKTGKNVPNEQTMYQINTKFTKWS